jgi:hypothetical protein
MQTKATGQLLDSDTLRWGGKISATGNFTAGNLDRYLFNFSAEGVHVKGRVGVKSALNYTWGKFYGSRTENDLLSRSFLYLDPQKRNYPFFMLWLESSVRRKIDFRNQYALGVTHRFTMSRKSIVKFSLSVSYDDTKYYGNTFTHYEDSSSRVIQTWRMIARVYGQHELVKGKLRWRYELWAQPSLENVGNYRWHAESGLDIPFTRRMAFRTSFNYYYDHVINRNLKNYDVWWSFGLTLGNY